jgi:hypothetical protein
MDTDYRNTAQVLPTADNEDALGGTLALASDTFVLLPDATPVLKDPCDPKLTRRGLHAEKRSLNLHRGLLFDETRGMKKSPEKDLIYKRIQDIALQAQHLENHEAEKYIPAHSATQLLSPRAFFASPLFRVCKENDVRETALRIELLEKDSKTLLRYEGPELRQSDGLVFLTLMHLTRDVQAGVPVSFRAEDVCKVLFGGYDGHSRVRLQLHVQRLQKGLIIANSFSVQLCMCFEFPNAGLWTVGLDPKIVGLFQVSRETWLRLEPRLSLPSGLATWLFSFAEAQTKLIPMPLKSLRKMCGSKSTPEAFSNSMRRALKHLVNDNIIDPGWSIRRGEVRWMKALTRASGA